MTDFNIEGAFLDFKLGLYISTTIEESSLREIVLTVGAPFGTNKGYFHRWCLEPFYADSIGYVSRTFALIELSDGTVHLVHPSEIKFIPQVKRSGKTSI